MKDADCDYCFAFQAGAVPPYTFCNLRAKFPLPIDQSSFVPFWHLRNDPVDSELGAKFGEKSVQASFATPATPQVLCLRQPARKGACYRAKSHVACKPEVAAESRNLLCVFWLALNDHALLLLQLNCQSS